MGLLLSYKYFVRNANNNKYLMSSFSVSIIVPSTYTYTCMCMHECVCVCLINCYYHSIKQVLLLAHFTGDGSEAYMQKPSVLPQVENGRARIQSNSFDSKICVFKTIPYCCIPKNNQYKWGTIWDKLLRISNYSNCLNFFKRGVYKTPSIYIALIY